MKNRGITLIALVVTILILLILAAVSVSMLTGENGVIKQAQNAREETIIGDEKESISLAYSSCKADNMMEIVSNTQLQEELTNNGKNTTVKIKNVNDLQVMFNETKHRYIIHQNGEIERIADLIEDRIIDAMSLNDNKERIFFITEDDNVKLLKQQLDYTDIKELEIKDTITLTENGVKETGYNYFMDNSNKLYIYDEYLFNGLNIEYEEKNVPICLNEILGVDQILQIAGSMVLANNGKVYTWGYNSRGQIGNGTTETSYLPICLNDLEGNALKDKKIVYIHRNEGSSFAIDDNGKLYSWGGNGYGQLGIKTWNDSYKPVCVSDMINSAIYDKKIKKIQSNWWKSDNKGTALYCIAIDELGKVYTWGYNGYWELGDETKINRNEPICISDLNNDLKGKNIVEITAGSQTSATDVNGNIYEWGSSEIKKPTLKIDKVKEELKKYEIVKQGYNWALDKNGKVYTWGNNEEGALGNGNTDDCSEPICINNIEETEIKNKKINKMVYFRYNCYFYITEEGKVFYSNIGEDV